MMNYHELFDLRTDPNELRSVYGRPEYTQVQKDLLRDLDQLREDLHVPSPDPPESMIEPAPRRRGG